MTSPEQAELDTYEGRMDALIGVLGKKSPVDVWSQMTDRQKIELERLLTGRKQTPRSIDNSERDDELDKILSGLATDIAEYVDRGHANGRPVHFVGKYVSRAKKSALAWRAKAIAEAQLSNWAYSPYVDTFHWWHRDVGKTPYKTYEAVKTVRFAVDDEGYVVSLEVKDLHNAATRVVGTKESSHPTNTKLSDSTTRF